MTTYLRVFLVLLLYHLHRLVILLIQLVSSKQFLLHHDFSEFYDQSHQALLLTLIEQDHQGHLSNDQLVISIFRYLKRQRLLSL